MRALLVEGDPQLTEVLAVLFAQERVPLSVLASADTLRTLSPRWQPSDMLLHDCTVERRPDPLAAALRLVARQPGLVYVFHPRQAAVDRLARVFGVRAYWLSQDSGPFTLRDTIRLHRANYATPTEPPHPPLTAQQAILRLVIEGKSNSEIGAALHLARSTVQTQVGRVMAKLNVPNRAALIRDYGDDGRLQAVQAHGNDLTQP